MNLQAPRRLSDIYKCGRGPEKVIPVHENLFAYNLFHLPIITRLFNFNCVNIFLIAYLRKYTAYLFLCIAFLQDMLHRYSHSSTTSYRNFITLLFKLQVICK